MRPAALLLTALLVVAPLAAQERLAPVAVETPAGTWSLTPAFVSEYMFRGARLGGPCFQPALEYNHGALSVGLWSSIPLEDHVVDGSEPEVDYYASYTFELPHQLSLIPGVNLYTYPGAAKSDGYYPVTIEPSLELTCTVGPVQISPKLYYDFMLKGPTAELTAAWAVPLASIGTELDFSATIGTFRLTDYAPDSAPAVKNWGDYWLIGVAVPYQFSPASRITVGWAYTAGSDNYLKQGDAGQVANPAAQGHGVFTLSYTFTF